MDLENLSLEEKIDKLGYTNFNTFLKLNQLTADLLSHSRILEDDITKDLDQYMYLAAANIGIVLFSINGRYARNNITIKHDDVFKVKDLKIAFPKEVMQSFEIGLDSLGIEKHILNGASEMIEGIETALSFIPDYDPKYKSKMLNDTIKEGLGEVKKYASLCQRFGEILIDLGKEKEGDIIKSGMERLTKSDELFKKIKNKKFPQILKSVVAINAQIYNLPYDGDPYVFQGKTGDQIKWAMSLANDITDLRDYITNAKLAGRKKFIGTTRDGFQYLEKDAERLNDLVAKKGLANAIVEKIIESESIEPFIDSTNAPFDDLACQLESLGIPYELATRVTDKLSIKVLNRGVTNLQKAEEKECYQILAKNKSEIIDIDKYAESVKMLVERNTGKKIPDVVLSYFPKEVMYLSNSISRWVVITETTKKGKIKEVKDYSSNQSWEHLSKTVPKIFSKPKYDILISENTGVCTLFEFVLGYSAKSDFTPLIEVQDNFFDEQTYDELASLFSRTEVMAHEMVHASQIDSKLAWRDMAVWIAHNAVESALEYHKEGKFDYESIFNKSSFKKKLKQKKTWASELIRMINDDVGQAIGLGEFAEKCRKKGIDDTLAGLGKTLMKDGEFNPKYLLNVGWEDSETADLINEVKEALQEKNIKKLRRLKKRTKKQCEEMTIIMETMAETFGFISTKNFIENYPENLSDRKKKYYIKSLEAQIVERGIKGSIVSKIIKDYKDRPQKMENELNKKGFTYKRVLSKHADEKIVRDRLRMLKYNPLNPFEAYQDLKELKNKIKKRNEVVEKKLIKRLTKLGYDISNFEDDFDNVEELEERIAEYNKKAKEKIYLEDMLCIKWKFKDLLCPVNNSKSLLDIRYSKDVPMFLKVVEKYGPYKAHELMLNAESLKEIKNLVK